MVSATSQQEFSDADWRAVATADQSKKLKLLLSGLTTGTTRVWTASDKDGTVLLSSDLAANVLTFLGTPSSANLAAALTDELGSGNALFGSAGTFTPALSATGCTFSYASQTGRYTLVGNWLFYSIWLQLNTSGNVLAANNLSVTGFPASCAADATGNRFRTPINWFQSTASYVSLTLEMNASAATARITGATAAATNNVGQQLATNVLHATNGTVLIANGFYEV
jgi:hypothetical protein